MRRDNLEQFGKNHGSTSDCHSQIIKVAGYTPRLEDTQKWAQNLRFLAYDGDGFEGERTEGEDDEGEDDEDEHDEDGHDGNDGAPFSECIKCRGLPYFPHSSPVKALRLTSDLELGDCSDYLAVSYCQSQNRSKNSSSSIIGPDYVARKPDGAKWPT
ncbi:hypothetical protein BDZ45DRAFT_745467 [Acephala macrosclerotiorum]|nr:hypothetical protein BDZ45DRAFT_745467 [Acephala macrosclerotiorum]